MTTAQSHLIQRVKQPETEMGVHRCFGNCGGQPVQKGFWKDLVPLFNSLDCGHLVLEFARRGYGELESLKELDSRIGLGLGVIDIKDNIVETPELVARRIETAARIHGEDKITWVHPDCGFWMLPRSGKDAKMRALVLGRERFLGS